MLQFTLIVIFINPINIIGNTNGALQPETQKNFRAYLNRPATNSSSAFEHRIDVPEENASLLEKISNNQLLSNPSKPTHTFDHRIDIPDNLSFIQQHEFSVDRTDVRCQQHRGSPFPDLLFSKNGDPRLFPVSPFPENQYSTSNCSVYEHIIDIPETATFLEQFESSPYEIKSNYKFAQFPQNEYQTSINVGQNLIGIVNKFSNYCRHIDGNVQRRVVEPNMDMGKKLCFVGMFVSMSEFINKKMTENIEQFTKRHKNWVSANPKLRQRLGLYDVNKHAVPKQFLERQNTSQMADLYTNMIFYSLSIDQMFNFWIKTKSIMTAANKTNDDKDQKHRILSQEIKKKLDDLTRETLFDFISSKIELEA
uniref:Uncharacterized protein n=1 Tax=Globodera rostochiensis TaxID=31243 RepID=A0A914IBD2_GLORO